MEFVAFDLETTGLGDSTEICEFAFVLYRDGELVETLTSRVKPSHNAQWQSGAIKIHGITKESVKSAPPLVHFKHQIASFVSGRPVFAHNASFDLNRLMSEIGLRIEAYCTQRISQELKGASFPKKLDDIAKSLGIVKADLHDALGDAIVCAEVAHALFTDEGVTSADDLAERFSRHILVPTDVSTEKAAAGPKNDKSLRKADFDDLAAGEDFGKAKSPHFTNKTVIFSDLKVLSKFDAQTLILRFGGFSLDNVSKETDFLVMGDIKKETTKKKSTDRINARGGSIRVITEAEFILMVEETGEIKTLLS
jgi:DNA polymerase III epsilon subunit-like protein